MLKDKNKIQNGVEEEPLNTSDEKTYFTEDKSNHHKTCVNFIKNVTVEPVVLFFLVALIITAIASQNLKLEKACRVNLKYSDENCTSLKLQKIEGQNQYEKETQKLLASALAWKTYISATAPFILALFVGSWSDRTGRRTCILLVPIAGNFLVCVNDIIQTYFLKELGLEYLVFIDGVLEGFSGAWCVLLLLSFSYISAITTEETRTFRLGLVNFAVTAAFPIGMGSSGILLKEFGYYGCYILAAFLHFINFFYCLFFLKDPARNNKQKQHDNKGCSHLCRIFFDLSNLKETINVIRKDTPNNRKFRLCILLLIVCLLFGPYYGELAIMYMTTRYRFNWDEVQFSVFQTYNFFTHTIGTMFSVIVLSKWLKWHDCILGILSTLSKIAASFVYCFAATGNVFYMAPLVEILNGTALLAIRSIVSKSVEVNELGKINSLFNLTESLMPLLFVPLYTKVYTLTMDILPGSVFLMGGAVTVLAFLGFIWLLIEYRREQKKLKQFITSEY